MQVRCGGCALVFDMAMPPGSAPGSKAAANCPQCGTVAERECPKGPAPVVAQAVVATPVVAAQPALAVAQPILAAVHAVAVPYVPQGYAAAPAALAAYVATPLVQDAGAGAVSVRAEGFTDPIHEGGKPHRDYFFVISIGVISERVQCRFSDLRREFSCVQGVDFPSRYFFSDMNTPANARSRSSELHHYLQQVLNMTDLQSGGQVTLNPSVHSVLKLSPSLAQAMANVGAARATALQLRLEAEEAARRAIRAQQMADADFAQRVNHMAAAPGQAVTMLFPRQLNFELRNKMFSWRDQVKINGPGGIEWFSMLRASSIFSMLDTEVIATLSGEPLLALHRQFRWMHYEYRLERLGAGQIRVPLCVVTREWQFFGPATYNVVLLGPSFGGAITCQGRWLEDFVLYQQGMPASTVRRRRFSIPECYDVTIEPNRDVLLFLGVACAIDHIHHEIEEQERRR